MGNSYNLLVRLTEPSLAGSQRRLLLRQFADVNGWLPSDQLEDYPGLESVANGHLVVEHGLANTAVITFLRADTPLARLSTEQKLTLLSISYNNLVDWHYFPDREGLNCIDNRVQPIWSRRVSIHEDPDCWKAEAFERITGRRTNPNLKRLDSALIETLSLWKRLLAAELGDMGVPVKTEDVAVFFNSILFVRAFEDYRRHQSPNLSRALIDAWTEPMAANRTIQSCIVSCLQRLECPPIPSELLKVDRLSIFDNLDGETVVRLFSDFYDNRFAPYRYDFSLMSKHALSRIYERYVSMLREPYSSQQLLFSDLPDEVSERALGGVYTPQYIARFFGRFLKANHTPTRFRELRTCDPACGSGIFLRTLLEMQCDPLQDGDVTAITQAAFEQILGIDVDPGACEATVLSLSLLHLVLSRTFPKALAIKREEAVKYLLDHPERKETFDAVVANPPYTKWDEIPASWRERIATFMADGEGKVGMFLALLKVGMELVRPGGFLLYVLPHSFLLSESAAFLRREIANNYWVRFLVNLHNIPVFKDVGTYVILLVLQKKTSRSSDTPPAVLVRCTDFVGHALQNALDGKRVSTDFYDIYEADQSQFTETAWYIMPPAEAFLQQRLCGCALLDSFLDVRQGFVTGADSVFIVDKAAVPSGEEAIYLAYLPDREMRRYSVPKEPSKFVFYPFVGQTKITEDVLRRTFPRTWRYLIENRPALEDRPAVKAGTVVWWSPERPRSPKTMQRAKIVSPHLVLIPRFGLDSEGSYGVSRSPLLQSKRETDELPLLKYFLAVLNSSVMFWQIKNQSHKYSRGYAMLEVKTLRLLRVPDPKDFSAGTIRKIIAMVDDLIEDGARVDTENRLDRLIADLYGMSESERLLIGMEP